MGLVLFNGGGGAPMAIAGVGFCGGYTTFSTASFETIRSARDRQYLAAVANGVGTLMLTVSAGGLGLLLAQW
ncbi:fluoride efflux transporter FluC [Nocardia cyriacigeorgica]|uniref:fluoride efflux transporter FluC n=1 Tax=Nocardia cyriacigeorgica TaxID=135487 RepID=UPI00308A2685|nr:hypothetical protein FMUBM48_14400 [Nocardia cyriacigeorgica]